MTRDDPGPAAVTTPLRLAVEVLSPSSRSVDLVLKRELYRQAGVRSYWVVDPLPSVDVWELDDDGQYGDPRTVVGDAELRLEAPYAVVLQPEALLR